MFRVQFNGESKQQALEHCGSCVQSLAQYITVQVLDGNSQAPGPLRAGGSGGEGCVPSIPLQHGVSSQCWLYKKPGLSYSLGAGMTVAFVKSIRFAG